MDSAKTRKAEGISSSVCDLNQHHFSGKTKPGHQQLLTWRERIGHIIEGLPSLTPADPPLNASIDHYRIGDRRFSDCRCDALLLDRSVARISTDNHRDYVFHVFTEGENESIEWIIPQRPKGHCLASILLLDLNQPIRMQRGACRVLTLFVPRAVVDANFAHPESLHGRVFESASPLTQLLVAHMAEFSKNLPVMSAHEAGIAFDISVQLLIAAFGKQATLSSTGRAAVRAALFDKARRYVQGNLHQALLSPESLLDALQLSRPTLYRLFEHEGGLVAYIRNCRLREAADELIKFPQLSVTAIAYGLDFKSPSAFNRAFRRFYEMAPQDLRALALQRLGDGTSKLH